MCPYEDTFLKYATHLFKNKKQVEENWWDYNHWISFLGKFNIKKAMPYCNNF
jgi:hypothetical protein